MIPARVMVHGRFQPFHLGHLDYVLHALRLQPDALVIGITNPDVSARLAAHPSDAHRHLPEANPFDYVVRAQMIVRSLRDIDHDGTDIILTGFDVNNPATWGVIPSDTVQCVSVMEEWDAAKADRFEEYGYPVIRADASRRISGSQVRDAWRAGRAIDHLVPSGTLSVLRALPWGSDPSP